MKNQFDPSYRLFEKIWNSYLKVPLPWKIRVSTSNHWKIQKFGDIHGPDKFIELTKTSAVLINEILATSPLDSLVLDLGCNVGRHLNQLFLHGYKNLYGVDVQIDAVNAIKNIFPKLFDILDVRCSTFQEFLPKIQDNFFDTSFTHGATIELVSPTFDICAEISRVTSKNIILLINEGGHYYPRLWERDFLKNGFILSKLVRPCVENENMSLLSFRRI